MSDDLALENLLRWNEEKTERIARLEAENERLVGMIAELRGENAAFVSTSRDLQQENAALRAKLERLTAPLSHTEYLRFHHDYATCQFFDFNGVITARASAEKEQP